MPWEIAQLGVDEIFIKLNDYWNDKNIKKEQPIEGRSKFQQRLDDAMEKTRKVKNGN